MIERKMRESRMVAMQLTTDEGAFICNMTESDLAKISAKTPGSYVVIHCAIRLDAMFDGAYEIYKTKTIETSSIAFHQSFSKKTGYTARRGQPSAHKEDER